MLYCVPVCPGDNPPSLTATILLATVQDCVPVRPGDNALSRAGVSGRQSSQFDRDNPQNLL